MKRWKEKKRRKERKEGKKKKEIRKEKMKRWKGGHTEIIVDMKSAL
jgi:hypothetical protein